MGIIDFREIVSPKADHVSGKDAPVGKSNLTDDFEVFCQEFFKVVRGFRIFKAVSKGPDGGIDLGVEEARADGGVTRWLVSCKHKAHSGKAVSDAEEKNIIERVSNWECDGFIPFYTTPPAATVDSLIDGVEKFGKRVERYMKDRIEQELLGSPAGIQLAARYFPRSMVNHYTKIVETVRLYEESDLHLRGEVLYGPGGIYRSVRGATEAELASAREEMIHLANVLATMDLHKPYFVHALNDAIKLAPAHFQVSGPIVKLGDLINVRPTWSAVDLVRAAHKQGLAFMYFVGAVWSFWDWDSAQDVFARAMAIRNELPIDFSDGAVEELEKSADFSSTVDHYKRKGLLTPGLVAIKLQEEARDVIARLVAFACAIP